MTREEESNDAVVARFLMASEQLAGEQPFFGASAACFMVLRAAMQHPEWAQAMHREVLADQSRCYDSENFQALQAEQDEKVQQLIKATAIKAST